jgi:hypothetical protein
VLSHALLLQGKLPEARNAVQRATELSLTSSDPALKLPAAIQHARVEIASAAPGASTTSGPLAAARLELRTVVATARKLGYYQLECEARILLGELEVKINPVTGRSQLSTLASETRRRGLQLLARDAEQALSGSATVIAVNKPTP